MERTTDNREVPCSNHGGASSFKMTSDDRKEFVHRARLLGGITGIIGTVIADTSQLGATGRYFYDIHKEQWQREHRGEYFGIIFPTQFPFAEPRFYFAKDQRELRSILREEQTKGEQAYLGSVDMSKIYHRSI